MYYKALVLYFFFTIFAFACAQVVITPTIVTTGTPTTANTSAVVTATVLPRIPPCAVQCVVTAALAVGCKGITDIACICKNRIAFLASFVACLALTCGAADAMAAQTAYEEMPCPVATATVIPIAI